MGEHDKTSVSSDLEHNNVMATRDELSNIILVSVTAFGLPILFISYLRYLETGGLLTLSIHLFLYLCCMSITIYRKKFPVKVKSLIIIGGILILAITSTVKWGIIGTGVAYYIFSSVLLTIFYGVKPGVVITGLNLVILSISAVLFNTGVLKYDFDINKYLLTSTAWISTVSVYGCFTFILIVGLSRLYNSIFVSIEKLANHTSELTDVKERMETEIKIRKEAETALKVSEDQLRVVLDSLPVSVFVHDLDGNNLIINNEACKTTGFSREELLNKNVEETESDSFDIDDARKTWKKLIETGEVMTFEFLTHRKDGTVRYTEIHSKSIKLHGRPVILVVDLDITERKKAETALRESEERFRTVLENLPCGVSVHDLDGRHLIVNEETCSVKGYSREELMNLTVMETAGPSFRESQEVIKLWEQIELGASFTFEASTQRKDGSLYDSEVFLSKIMLDGRPVILSLVFDITKRKQSEEALKKSETYLRTLISTIPDLVWLKDVDGKFLYCNSRFEDLFGARAKDIVGKTDYDYIEKEIADIIRKRDKESISKIGSTRIEEAVVFINDGHREILETIRKPMYSSDGVLVGILAIGRDITERKRIEASLERRSELERLISEISSGFVGVSYNEIDSCIDEALASIGKKLAADRAYLFLFHNDGKTVDNTNEWCSENTTPQIDKLKNIKLEEEFPWFYKRICNGDIIHIPDVERMPFEAQIEKVHFDNHAIKSLINLVMRQGGKLIGFIGFDAVHEKREWSEDEIVILRIINETFMSAIQQKQAEKEQERLKAQLSMAVELAHLGPWELDTVNMVYTFNDHFYKIYHTNAEEMGGYTMSVDEYKRRFVHPDDIHLLDEIRKKDMGTDAPTENRLEHRMLYADGTTGYLLAQAFRVKNSKGIPVKAYGVNQDITDWKIAQEKLRESEEKLARSRKMESLGLLAGGVAHDLNNVLSGIVSYPELLLMDLPANSKLRKPIETIQESGHKAVAIVQDLLTIARGAATTKEPLNLNRVINEYLNSPEFNNLKTYHPSVKFVTDLESGLFNLNGSLIHIKKVIMNLVSNASEAIEEHGTVTISTRNRYIDMPLSKYEDVKVGEYVVLTVLDNGPGIAPENLDRIFEPFFTKKVMGISGTGLGLTVVWNTVQDHSGYIDVTSDSSGTKFEIYFPITRDKLATRTSSISLDQLKGNGELILVVDDVDSQREISCRMLDALGYRYIAVSGGEKAIEFLKNNKADLVLLDMIMAPGISGRETYEHIVRIRPGQKALIISGYSETEDVTAIQRLGAGGYVKKPFSLESLGRGIKKELQK